MTTDETTLTLESIAADLLAAALDTSDGGYPVLAASAVTLPNGDVVSLSIMHDDDTGIGDMRGMSGGHHDDAFGAFAWRDGQGERPAGFDGRARVLRPRDNGARIGDPVWWQPPADVEDVHLPELEADVRAYMETGDWHHVGLVVERDGERASLWGVDYGFMNSHDPTRNADHRAYYVATIADLLHETGADPGLDPGPDLFTPTHEEDVAPSFARLLDYIAGPLGAPMLAADLARRGARWIPDAARAWRDVDMTPRSFADTLDSIAPHYADGDRP